ncbi:signal peptide peptidase SppA [Sphingomicrobium sp. XHP0235]|uniref:signal peptide peptidase SppA n=1 Tax=Sphingomicrobium aquimarinum TaxID=3133971 RepID=UPI0031FE4B01
MSFARTIWKLLVGVKDLMVLIFMFLFFGLLFVALKGTPDPVVGDGVLVMDLDGIVVEQASAPDPLSALAGAPSIGEWEVAELVATLEAAKDDDRVEAVALDLDGFLGGGLVAMTTLGAAIEEFAEEKPVVAYATAYVGDGYQLAAHATEVHLNPLGTVALAGPGGNNLYFAELLDNLGVTANVYRAGDFKSATEPYTRSDMSPEARQNAEQLAGALFDQWREDVKAARPVANIDRLLRDPAEVAEAQPDLARAALDLGLVDTLSTRREYEARLAELGGVDEDAIGGFERIELANYIGTELDDQNDGDIGVVTIAGTIVDGFAPTGQAAGDSIAEAIREAGKDGGLEALVVRIDSPGGSVLASEAIRVAIEDVKNDLDIPVVASFGNVAASGGYWVAMPADAIFAEPSSVTGSIGVFAVLPSFEGTMEKLGIGVDGVKTTPLSGEPDLFAGPSAEADVVLQAGVDSIYDRFLTLVAQNRDIPKARADTLGGGRVYDGGTARQLGLVDRFGGLDEAIAHAAELAGIEGDPSIRKIERADEFGFLATLLGARANAASIDPWTQVTGRPDAQLAQAVHTIEQLLRGPAMQARCLACERFAPVPTGSAGEEELSFVARLLARLD